jgi:hypothetical protein
MDLAAHRVHDPTSTAITPNFSWLLEKVLCPGVTLIPPKIIEMLQKIDALMCYGSKGAFQTNFCLQVDVLMRFDDLLIFDSTQFQMFCVHREVEFIGSLLRSNLKLLVTIHQVELVCSLLRSILKLLVSNHTDFSEAAKQLYP